MHLSYVSIAVLALASCVYAETDSEPKSLKERFFRNDTAKFDKYCGKLYENLAKTGNGTIDLAVLKTYYADAQAKEAIPKDLTFHLDHADKDQDGKITRNEFCSDLDAILSEADVDDLKELSKIKLNSKWQEYVCKIKNKAPAVFGGKCPADDQALAKRQVSIENKNAWKGIGITALVLGSLTSIGILLEIGGMFTALALGQFALAAAALLLALPFVVVVASFWFILAKMSLGQAHKLKLAEAPAKLNSTANA